MCDLLFFPCYLSIVQRVYKAVIKAKGGYFENSKIKIYIDSFNTLKKCFYYYMIQYVLFHSFYVLTIILDCKK